MNKNISKIELRPDRSLLDSSFEGYKLSLDSIPIYRHPIVSGVHFVQPDDDQFSYYHVKMFSLHNHLYSNQYKPNDIYFVDKHCKILKIILNNRYQVSFKEVYKIPDIQHGMAGNYNVSIKFASSELVVISNGAGCVHLAKVNGQGEAEVWENLQELFQEKRGFVLADVKIESDDSETVLHLVLLEIEDKPIAENNELKTSSFCTMLKWRAYFQCENGIWEKKFDKVLSINGSVDYVALEPGCKSIYVISDKLPKWTHDSENPLLSENNNEENLKITAQEKIYVWTQTVDEITVRISLPEGTQKSDLSISVNDSDIKLTVCDKEIISGQFFHNIVKDLTTWTYEKNQLEIQLTKQENGLMWKFLITDDDEKGEEIIDENLVKDIHEKLAHLCSDQEESGFHPPFNSQQLEDCDSSYCDTTSLVRINGENHKTTHEVSLSSSHWLFKVNCDPSQTPAICCRHDVDACVWQFSRIVSSEENWPHKHIGTFSAFGYVQASKTQKKFLVSPPDLSYVAICEASHHIYIYRQPCPLTSELKNRHTGKKISKVSKQQLVNLETNEQILGVHATNQHLIILLESCISILVLNV